MASTYSDQITQTALAMGVPPSIALAVAMQESGIQQYNPDGSLVMGGAGDTGIFQIIPSTARALNVNPADPTQNIQGGVSLLASLYQKFGDWASALSAYNSGSPTKSTGYANSVLNIASQLGLPGVSAPTIDMTSTDLLGGVASPWTGALIVGGILAALGLAWWATD